MKILYLAILPILDDNLGVVKKIKEQVQSMRSESIDVTVFVFFKNDSTSIRKDDFPQYFNFYQYPYNKYKKITQLFNLWNIITQVSHAKNHDIIYFRNPGSSFFLYLFLKKYRNKVILEHNTKELDEIKLRSTYPNFALWKEVFFAKRAYKYALGNVGKASEFSDHQQYKVKYALNLRTITNGISVKNIQKKIPSTSKTSEHINLIFVGNTSIWHGLERLLIGIQIYSGPLDFKLYLVGKEKTFSDMLCKLNFNEQLNKKIVLTGFKTGNDLDDLFNIADFAIGSLGLHRINILSGAPLKHREYLSRGLPFIYSGNDEDIKGPICKYLFNVVADESPIDIIQLLNFITNINNDQKDIAGCLTNYALNNIDMAIKSNELIDFITCSINKKKNESK